MTSVGQNGKAGAPPQVVSVFVYKIPLHWGHPALMQRCVTCGKNALPQIWDFSISHYPSVASIPTTHINEYLSLQATTHISWFPSVWLHTSIEQVNLSTGTQSHNKPIARQEWTQ